MRLDDKTRNIIKTEVASLLGADAVVRLFGMLLHRRVIRKLFPKVSRTLQNGLTGSLVWLLAAMPAAWAVVFYQSTTALVIGFFLASFGYMVLFARLTQFVWCFQAATMRRTEMLADRPG